jgi:cytidylate kinase
MTSISRDLISKQNADTSREIIASFEADPDFLELSRFEGDLIVKRDEEDGEKLAAGIKISVERGSLPKNHVAEPYHVIDVLGKTPEEVAEIILSDVGEAASTGSVIVLCGLSGTGKGTTVSILSSRLPHCSNWSNGNIFRSITLLAATWCEQNGFEAFNADASLTDSNIADFMKMLSFEKLAGKWDVVIRGLGFDTCVGEIQNTLLKAPKVAVNIPTVAKVTQGEVIAFASHALSLMKADGNNVLLEGREQTVDYIPTPHRYTLVLSDQTLLGKRRAAQRLAAAVFSAPAFKDESISVASILDAALREMVAEARNS